MFSNQIGRGHIDFNVDPVCVSVTRYLVIGNNFASIKPKVMMNIWLGFEDLVIVSSFTIKPVLSSHSKIDKTKVLKTNGSLMGRKYCRMLPFEHSAILLTCIKQYSVLKTHFGLLFERPLKTGFTIG